MIDRLITEHTTGRYVDGATGALVERPTRVLTLEEATVLRNYFSWAMRAQLEPELVCADCFDDSRASRASYQIDDDQIIIICRCAMRFYQGPTLLKLNLPQFSGQGDESGPAQVILSEAVAGLLRKYKKTVLAGLNLREMLRCNACWELGQPDGCDASVTDMGIRIRCRCTDRRYIGGAA